MPSAGSYGTDLISHLGIADQCFFSRARCRKVIWQVSTYARQSTVNELAVKPGSDHTI